MTAPTITPTQGMAGQGASAPQQGPGQAPGFPAPLGIEQYLGLPQQYPQYLQQYPQYPQYQVQQVVQQLVAQILPMAQQVVLPQVVAAASQQIHQQLQQLVAQYVSGQPHGGLGSQSMAGGGQPPFTGQYGSPFGQAGRPFVGGF